MTNNLNNIIASSFSAVQIPKISENIGRADWITFGDDNLYAQYLLELYSKSTINSSILNSIGDFISGEGFEGNDTFLENANGTDTLDKILEKVALDIAIFGSFALDVIYNRGGKLSHIEHIPVQTVRIAKPSEDKPQGIYISSDWSNLKKNKPVWFQSYDPNNVIEGHQVMYVKKYRAGIDYYTLPHYTQALNWIELDIKISQYHLNAATNGWTPSLLINVNKGIPSDDEKDEFKRNLDATYTGVENANKYVLSFNESAENAIDITPIQNDISDKKYLQLIEQMEQMIMNANKVTSPMLFGFRVPGQLGGTTELIDAFNMYQKTVIGSFQDVITGAFNSLSSINGYGEITIKQYEL